MDLEEFRQQAHELVDWMADYFAGVESYPVRSNVRPGDIIRQLPRTPPEQGEPFENLFADFQRIILPGITHWQHPSFFAYFTANTSYPSVLAEMLTATLGAQCMSWQTSPAAAELEERVMEWMRQLIGLPDGFTGVIQDTASTATLCSLITAREKHTGFAINRGGFAGAAARPDAPGSPDAAGSPGRLSRPFTIYASTEAHSSIEKAVKIAGFGKEHLRKIEVDRDFAMIPRALESAVEDDIRGGYRPLAVVAAMGTTGSTAVDPLEEIGHICKRHGLWLHIDAAYAGTALVLPEMRWMSRGVELADSFVFNPHKWMFTNFDCSAYFVQDTEALVRTFEILPEYLKTREGDRVNNYRDWGIPLGRRFRALKLWFVIRSFGAAGIREKIGAHIQWAKELAAEIDAAEEFELLAPVPLALVCFRYRPQGVSDPDELNALNARLLEAVNDTGKLYLTHTKLGGTYALRLNIGQTRTEKRHVEQAWALIRKMAGEL
jgi:aromatic-L-amino-acid decarboxylase